MTHTFDLFLDKELTWLQRPIQVLIRVKVLGCVINILGDPHDPIGKTEGPRWSIHRDARGLCSRVVVDEVITARIKAIDLITQYQKGGRINSCLFGGDGLGKTALTMEMTINVAMGHGKFSVLAGVDEQIRPRREFYRDMIDSGVIKLEANQETLAVLFNNNNMTPQAANFALYENG